MTELWEQDDGRVTWDQDGAAAYSYHQNMIGLGRRYWREDQGKHKPFPLTLMPLSTITFGVRYSIGTGQWS